MQLARQRRAQPARPARPCRRETPSSRRRPCPRALREQERAVGRSITAAATSITRALLSSWRVPCRAQSRANCQATRPLREPRCSAHCSASSRACVARAATPKCFEPVVDDVEVLVLVERIERTHRPKRSESEIFSSTVSPGMDLVADVLGLEVLVHVLRHQVAAVGGRVDQQVLGGRRDRAVEHHLERLVAGLVAVERQVVAEQDEALRAAPATWSTMSGRSTRSCFSTSIRRRPCSAYLLSSALTSDDLPVPRAPVSSTLLAGLPSTNWRVFCSTSSSARRCPQVGELDAVHVAHRLQLAAARHGAPALRQRNAMLAFQSVGAAAAAAGAARARCEDLFQFFAHAS